MYRDFYMLQLKVSHVKIPIHYILYSLFWDWLGINVIFKGSESCAQRPGCLERVCTGLICVGRF